MSDQYRVGQVIYVVMSKDRKVYPMLIIEEVTKRALGSDVITQYIAKAGPSGDGMVVSDIQGQIFHTPKEAKDALIAAVKRNIEKMVDNAVQKAHEWYPEASRASTTMSPDLPPTFDESLIPDDPQVEGETVLVDLGDGRVGRMVVK